MKINKIILITALVFFLALVGYILLNFGMDMDGVGQKRGGLPLRENIIQK